METLFSELKRYVGWDEADEASLRGLHPVAAPQFERISNVFYQRILDHTEARKALEGGESTIGHLKVKLQAWMDSLLTGPWDEAYYERRARIGRVHVRIALPQHYMFGAMNVLHGEFAELIDRHFDEKRAEARVARIALSKILDLELAIMLHTYREDLLAQRERSERLATFGQLVGSIGHELRNPLGVIETSLYLLRGRVGQEERITKHVDRIADQIQVANQIVSDLLDMIRDRPLERQKTALGPLLSEVVEATQHPANVQITLEHLDALPEIDGDKSKLRQVFMNLVENAVYAVGAAGAVRIDGVTGHSDVTISVADTGPGVDAGVRARLFEPLITTKTKGIGLGLPLVKRIVERHGGSVSYDPPPEGGARFVVRLPLRDGDA
jgi:signal transduction histidine kinase